MNRIAVTILAGMAAVGALTLTTPAPAGAAPIGPRNAADVIAALEDRGYEVILNKIGAAPLTDCGVTAVRPGRQVSELVHTSQGRNRTVERVKYATVHVDASC